jgi:hypothetical protein
MSQEQRIYPVTVDVGGKSYSGNYVMRGRIVTVTLGAVERSRQLGGVSHEILAMTLMREMVAAGLAPA